MIGKHVLLAAVLVSTAFFIGCSMSNDDGGSDDDGLGVSLSITDGAGNEASSFYSYQPFYAIAKVTDNIGTVDYTWYVNGTVQTGVTSSDDAVRLQIPASTQATYSIKVSVEDYDDKPVSATKSVTIKAAGALEIVNYSDYSITSLMYKTPSMSNWKEGLGGSIGSGYYSILYGISAGTYSLKAINSYGTAYTETDEYIGSGDLRLWNIKNDAGSSSFTNRTGVVSGTDILPDEDAGTLMHPASEKIRAVAFPVQE